MRDQLTSNTAEPVTARSIKKDRVQSILFWREGLYADLWTQRADSAPNSAEFPDQFFLLSFLPVFYYHFLVSTDSGCSFFAL